MRGYELFRVFYSLFLGLFLIIAGVLTFTAKGEPGIGFRIGYTYLSERAMRKANHVSGIGMLITGLLLIALSPFLSMNWLMVLLLICLGTTMLLAYLVAKREYELEELSKEAPEKPGRAIESPKVGKYIALQSIFAGFSFALLIAGKLPKDLGLLFMAFVLLFLLALTFLASRPLVFQLSPKFKGKMAVGFARAMTIVSAVMTFELLLIAINREPGPVEAIFLTFLSLGAVFYAVFRSLVSAYEEGYY